MLVGFDVLGKPLVRKTVVRFGVRDAELSATRMDESLQLKSMISTIAAVNLLAAGSAEAIDMTRVMEGAVYTIADGGLGDIFGGILYSAGQQANEAVVDQLSALSFTSVAVIFGAGLVTSLSPCTLSVLPLTLGYIGAFGAGKSKGEVIGNSVSFALGLATTLFLGPVILSTVPLNAS